MKPAEILASALADATPYKIGVLGCELLALNF